MGNAKPRGFITVVGILVLSSSAISCEVDRAPVVSPEVTAWDAQLIPESKDDLQVLASAFARVLADETFRQQLLEDLRDSPFEGYKIHLQSYLNGPRGRRVSRQLAERLGLPLDGLFYVLNDLPSAEMAISSSLDRVQWNGGSNLVVAGSSLERTPLLKQGFINAQ